jgi:signal transduction histidine kinase/PAS domain-containing protein
MPLVARKKKRSGVARRRDKLLLALHERLRPLKDPVAIQTAAVHVLGEFLGCDWANYAEYDDDYAHTIVRSEYLRDGAPSMQGRHRLESSGQFVAAQKAGRTIAVDDVHQSPLIPSERRTLYEALPLGAFAGVPVVKDGRLISTLFVSRKRPHAWTRQELRLIEETAEHTWAAVERAIAERDMRDSEVRLQLALDATGLGTFVWYVPKDRGEPGPRMSALLGLEPGRAFSFRHFLRDIVHPNDRRLLARAVTNAMDPAGPGTIREELRVIRADGSERWLSIIGQAAFEHDALVPSGDRGTRHVTRFSGIAADITDRKRRECNLALLDDIASDFARLSSADDIMEHVGSRVCDHLGADTCYLLDIDDAGNTFRAEYIWTRDGVQTIADTLPISAFVSEEFCRAARAGETIVVNYTEIDARTDAAAYAGFDIASFITVPFARDGAWRLLFAVCDRQPHIWRDDQVELFRDVANRLVPRIERARAEQAVAKDLRDTQLLRDLSARLVAEPDAESFFEAIAKGAIAITGARGASIHLLGEGGHGLVRLTSDHETWPSSVDVLFTQSTPLVARDGTTIGALFTRWPTPYTPSERSVRFLDLLARQASDMIERLRSDGALRESERRLSAELADTQLLQELSAKLIQDHGSESLYETLVEAAMSIMRSASASLQMLQPERDGEHLRLIASRGFTADAAARWARVFSDNSTTCAEALRRRERVVEPDITESGFMAGTADLAGYLQLGVRAGQTTPLMSRDGKLLGMISTYWTEVHAPSERDFRLLDIVARQAADLMERAQVEEALRRSERELKEADRRKDEFLATLAHELRNPLAPLRTSIELIRLAGDRPGAVEDVRSMMEEQLGQLVRLVDDLLDVSRITSGKIRLHRQPTSLVTLVNAAVHANQAALTAGRVSLRLAMPNVPVLIDADATRFVQVVSNVLQNAVKFTDAGGHITISASVTEPAPGQSREVALMITDSGVGITKEMLPRVFDRFMQGDAAVHRSHAGLGIGLALAKQLIEMHGGLIEAHSDGPGMGSSFTIRMPVLDGVLDQKTPNPPADAPRITRRVLVIDDNPAAATAMQRLVKVLGGECAVAYDGEGGLSQVREFRPDVVILDIGMPGIDGYETCRRIRAEFGPDLLVVALTGWGQDRDKRKAWRAGFDVHLTKPADPIALERLLSGVPADA